MATVSAQHHGLFSNPFTAPEPMPPAQQPVTPPDSSPATPKDQSPSSPRSTWANSSSISFAPKQIRSPRAPIYVPAVLRPTERPGRFSPPKKADNLGLDTAENAQDEDDSAPATRPLALRRMVTEEWVETSMGKVTGPPSRNHWKPDPASPQCDSPTCERSFTFITRRHHCRRCGHIFCSNHSPHYVPLDQHARFHPLAQRYRSCDDCFKDYGVWESERLRKLKEAGERASSADGTAKTSLEINGKKKGEGLMNSIAQSVPRDWSWSTF
ncbi:hypothetical protein BT63DRAFT_459118 [Microthyrium microscopicum]|uniref:FYVE-type domain-containing protein n=1 Tax=Microthyrium microscopicum TaxID=703497 RepID=A0A6A6U291_9PEZI|nr:hypothetical protein BT63DRAFT_459118 [Microthyrium microscopicum]